MIYTNTNQFGGTLKNQFDYELKNTNTLTIATGYFGADIIKNYHKSFIKISKKGSVRILIGMVFHKGLSKKQYDSLLKLDEKLINQNTNSGVFISTKEYHGKLYLFDKVTFIGSSNFSHQGIAGRLECNTVINNINKRNDISSYIEFLFGQKFTKKLKEVDLHKKTQRKDLKKHEDYRINEIPDYNFIGSFDIKLRVDKQPNSSLNLHFDKGRVRNGLYTPRPWYEVEITTTSKEQKNPLYPKSKLVKNESKSRIGYFNAYVKTGRKIYKINMSVSSDSGKAIASSSASGGRGTLGYILKTHLINKNVLKFGDRITSETLDEYGRDTLTFKKINDENYLIEF